MVYGIVVVDDAVVVGTDVRCPSCCFNCCLNPCLKQTGSGIWVATEYFVALLLFIVVSVGGASRQMQLRIFLDGRASAKCG